MPTPAKKMPEFASEDEEREFWATADSADYVDWDSAFTVRFGKLRPSRPNVTLTLPVALVQDLSALASKRGVAMEALVEACLMDLVATECTRQTP